VTALVIATFDPSKSKHLTHFPPETDWRVYETGFIRIDQRSFPHQVHLSRSDEFGSLEDFPQDKETGDHDLHSVIGPEVGYRPRLECGITVEDGDECHPDQCQVGTVRLEASEVCKVSAVHTLHFTGAVIADEGDADSDVVDKSSSSDKFSEPGNHSGRAAGTLQEGQHWENHDNDEAVDRNSLACGVCKEPRSSTLECQALESTDSAVGVRVAGGKDRGQK